MLFTLVRFKARQLIGTCNDNKDIDISIESILLARTVGCDDGSANGCLVGRDDRWDDGEVRYDEGVLDGRDDGCIEGVSVG